MFQMEGFILAMAYFYGLWKIVYFVGCLVTIFCDSFRFGFLWLEFFSRNIMATVLDERDCDIYVSRDNQFQAEQTLLSVIENYPGEGLKTEARLKLEKIAPEKEEQPQQDDEIEIE